MGGPPGGNAELSSSQQTFDLFPQPLPLSPPFTPIPHLLHPSSLTSSSSLAPILHVSHLLQGCLPPPQRKNTDGECRIHFFIAGRLFLEQMLHRPHNGGQGAPTCGGEKGQGWNHSKHDLARSPGQGMPRQEGPAAGAGSYPSCCRIPLPREPVPGVGKAWRWAGSQGDCAIRVCP